MNNLPEQTNGQVNIQNTDTRKRNGVRTVAVILTIVFCLLTAGLGLCGFIASDREFSEAENRVLASKPVFTVEGLLNGSFMKEVETYLSDQFPFRDSAIALKTFVDRIVGKREENGVYIGKNGFLFDSQSEYIKEKTEDKLKAINDFCEEYKNTAQLFVLSPNSSYIYKEYLPYDARLSDQQNQIEKVYSFLKAENLNKLDAADILKNTKESGVQLFYKTDHHWTTRAAYAVFEGIAEKWNLSTQDIKYEFYPVTSDFEGTLSGKAGIKGTKDTIEICVPMQSEGTYAVNFESKQQKSATLFDESKLSQKNKYEVFLGGNYDKVVITTTAQSEDTLLIVKDSFANCMIPMFTPYFTKIVVIDPRYLTDSMKAIMGDSDFTHILFLYNLNTFLDDTSIVSAFNED